MLVLGLNVAIVFNIHNINKECLIVALIQGYRPGNDMSKLFWNVLSVATKKTFPNVYFSNLRQQHKY